MCHHSCSEEEASSKGNIFSGLFPFVLNVFKRYRSQLQDETKSVLGDALAAMKDPADSATGVKMSNQSVEGFEIDSEELLEISENAGNEYPLKEEEPSRNSQLDLGDENIEGTKSKDSFSFLLLLASLLVNYRMLK